MSLLKNICIFIGIIISILLGFFYKILNDTGHLTTLQNFPEPDKVKCSSNEFKMQAAPEDLTKISEKIAVTGTSDRKQLWEDLQGPSKTPQGKLFAIDLENNNVHQIELINFPSNQKLQPHGIYYSFDTQVLSVISHGYDGMSSRILRFSIDQSNSKAIKATYQKSLFVDEQLYNGIINDLIQINENEYLITKYLHYADHIDGRYKKKMGETLISTFKFLAGIEDTYVLSCTYDLSISSDVQKLDCLKVENTYARMTNGITWNKKDQVIVADAWNTVAKVYKLNQQANRNERLQYQYTLQLTRHADNIEYDIYNDHYVAGGFGLINEYMLYVSNEVYPKKTYWASVDILKQEKNSEKLVKENILMKDDAIFGCSSALTYGNKLYLGTWCDTNLVTCEF